MVGAAVRIDHDHVLGVIETTTPVARKAHVCVHCGTMIVSGERYRRTTYQLTTGVGSEPEHFSYAACRRAEMAAEAAVSSQDGARAL